MAAAAIPAISLAANYFGNRGKRKQEEQARQTFQSSTTELSEGGTGLLKSAQPWMQGGSNTFASGRGMVGDAAAYYRPLVSGSRGALNAATAPERAGIMDYYRGADKAVEHSGARGGVRELALAENARSKAGTLGTLAPTLRANAAGALGQLGAGQQQAGLGQAGVGLGLTDQGTRMKMGAIQGAGGQAQLAQQQAQSRAPGNSAIGGMIFDVLQGQRGKKAGGAALPAGGGAPSFAGFAPTVGMSRP